MTLRRFTHRTRERVWRYRPFPWLEEVWRDLRFAIRSLVRTPGFTSITLLVIAVGIGVNTAVFSVVDAVLLKPLTYPDPQALVQLVTTSNQGPIPVASIPEYNIICFSQVRRTSRRRTSLLAFSSAQTSWLLRFSASCALAWAAVNRPGWRNELVADDCESSGYSEHDSEECSTPGFDRNDFANGTSGVESDFQRAERPARTASRDDTVFVAHLCVWRLYPDLVLFRVP
jgi:hypothetical protein